LQFAHAVFFDTVVGCGHGFVLSFRKSVD